MVFQKYNLFPKTIWRNVVFSLRVSGRNNKALLMRLGSVVCGVRFWDEVKDRLHECPWRLAVDAAPVHCASHSQ